MKRLLHMVAAAVLLAAATGCGSGLPAGQSGVRVLAYAEPKAGYVQPPAGTPGYSVGPEGAEDESTARRDPFRIFDYRNLEDIVVFLVPEDGSAASAPTPTAVALDAAGGPRGLVVSAVGGELRLTNSSAKPQSVYLRTEAGALTDVGTVAPGSPLAVSLTTPGAVTVYREADGPEDERLAEVYVAPNGWAAKAVSGGKVTFAPVPPGKYTLATWHPRLPGAKQTIQLPDGKYADATATVSVNALPKVP